MNHRRWLVPVTCFAALIALVSWFYLKSTPRTDPRALSIAEAEVYEAVIRALVRPASGQPKVSQLVFSDNVDHYLCPGVDIKSCEQGVGKRLSEAAGGTLHPETIQDFIRKSQVGGLLSKTFRTDLPRVFIDPNSVYFDIVPLEKNGQKDFAQTFPGAGGIISLSHVGFDPALHEAIVSSSFVCGGLCGTGWRHILRKKWGKWVVVESWIVWVS